MLKHITGSLVFGSFDLLVVDVMWLWVLIAGSREQGTKLLGE